MRSVKNYIAYRSLNRNKFNLVLTPRRWGLTTYLIKYINTLPESSRIVFCVLDTRSFNHTLITHPNCDIKKFSEGSYLIGRRYDYIICDNFFNGNWIKKLTIIIPTLSCEGKIVLADSCGDIGGDIEYFRNYNKIIKTI